MSRPEKTKTNAEGETVLILTPRGRDATLTCELLGRAGLPCEVCLDMSELCARIAAGDAGTAVLTEEVLTRGGIVALGNALAGQPAWSDFPLIVFSDADRATARALDETMLRIGNVTYLDRPVQARTMIAAVHAALRGRRRQYDARAAIASRDQFLAMLGHELRNPLAAVRLAVELLERRADEPAARDKQRSIIDRQTRHLARLVDDLLDVGRITYGKVTLQRAPVDLADVVRSAAQAIEQAARTAKLTLELDVPGEPLIVHADRVRLDQILSNLLTNAIKYTPANGRVFVTARAEGASAIVTVGDTGIGIDATMLPKVFELFAQADRSLDRANGGMGLGLTVVRSLVQLHDGEVSVTSKGLGHGSEFRVRLPRVEGSGATSDSASSLTTKGASRRIVLVEDNEDVRTALSDLLKIAGYEVTTAVDGPTGVESIIAETPDVAFVDVGLPGFDGYEVARRVRAVGKPVVLVALTGYGQYEDRKRAFEAGFDEHLKKPAGLDELESAMRAIG